MCRSTDVLCLINTLRCIHIEVVPICSPPRRTPSIPDAEISRFAGSNLDPKENAWYREIGEEVVLEMEAHRLLLHCMSLGGISNLVYKHVSLSARAGTSFIC